MKDYIITLAAVFTMTLGIILCHQYAFNRNYNEPEESVSEEPVSNDYHNWNNNNDYNYNDIASPAVTTVSTQKGLMMFQTTEITETESNLLTDVSGYDDNEYTETEITTTVSRSILENATAQNVTVHQFSIIQNSQIPQTETTPVIPDDFSLVIN